MDDAVKVIVGSSSEESASCTPVTVTVCAVFQFTVVKVRSPSGTDAASGSSDDKDTVTSAAGWVARRTSKVAVDPSATGRLDLSTTSLAVSSSSTSTSTSAVTPV